MLFEPFQERPGQVQHGRKKIPGGEPLEDRTIHVGDVLREDVVEVADGLMEMKAKDKADRNHGLPDDE
jgi:hypothetical protein